MILMIDNYDSFTYNIVHYLEELGHEVLVKRNDKISLEEIKQLNPKYIVLSPGPGRPQTAGVSLTVVKELQGIYPILGVCLGHQVIAEAFGGEIVKAGKVCHGKMSSVTHANQGVFTNLANPLKVVRYHSLVVRPDTLPSELEVTSTAEDGEIMGIKHRSLPIEGVQFHPESIGSDQGHELFNQFLSQHQTSNL